MSTKGTKKPKVLSISLKAGGFNFSQYMTSPPYGASSVRLSDDEDDEDAYGSRSRSSITRARGSQLVC